jgi:hypothetical protein
VMKALDGRLHADELLKDRERIGNLVALKILARLREFVRGRVWRGHLRGNRERRYNKKQKHTKTAHNGVRILWVAAMWKC